MFTHRDVVNLWKADDLSGPLQRLWEDRTGVYPLHAAQKIAKQEKALNSILIASSLFAFMTIVFASAIYQLGGVEWLLPTIFSATAGFLVSGLMYAMAFQRHHPDAEWDFPEHLWKFIDWSGMRPDIIAGKNQNDLRSIAKSILIETAGEILKREDEDERLRNLGSHNSLTKFIKEFKDLFAEQYRVLSNLGLVKGEHTPFYDAARAKITEEALAGTQTQALA